MHAALPFYLNNILQMTSNILHVVKYNIPCKSAEGLSVSSYNHLCYMVHTVQRLSISLVRRGSIIAGVENALVF